MTTATIGSVSRALLKVRDDLLRRCWWCGEWCYNQEDCTACTTPVDAPACTADPDLHHYACVELHGVDAACSRLFRLSFPVGRK